MVLLDWLIVLVLIVAIVAVAYFTKRYNKSVADFMAANRCAGRYLITVAEGMALMGAITFVADFQKYYVTGFSLIFWSLALSWPIQLFVALSGWVVYRFRQTRALTLAQFFEIRYSRRFRVFAGALCFISGIINFGIFPGVGAKFFVKFCEFPERLMLLGFEVPTFILVMIVLLSIALAITYLGGLIAIMVSDFLQGIIVLIIMIAATAMFYTKFNWSVISDTILTVPAADQSFVNPFKTGGIKGLNYWWALTAVIGSFYGCMAWQGAQGYNSAAKNPHEARMGGVIGVFRGPALMVGLVFMGICAFVAMHNVSFASVAETVNSAIGGGGGDRVATEMITPVVISNILPTGLLGAFCAVMIAAFIGNHDTFLHSWGTILVQDVLIPMRKKTLTQKQHLKWLRLSILGVAVFVFLWSAFLEFDEYILLYWGITSAIFMGGAGAVIIGGLYWKRGTTAGAYTALIVGSITAGGGLIWKTIDPNVLEVYWFSLISVGASVGSYVLVSLFGMSDFNLDQMLHRGKYAIEEDVCKISHGPQKTWKKLLGITKEFSKFDIFLYFLAFSYGIIGAVVAIGVAIWYFIAPKFGYSFGDDGWFAFWMYYLSTLFVLAVIFTTFLAVGGVLNLKEMFQRLKVAQRSDLDDGRVKDHHSLADEELLDVKFNNNKENDI